MEIDRNDRGYKHDMFSNSQMNGTKYIAFNNISEIKPINVHEWGKKKGRMNIFIQVRIHRGPEHFQLFLFSYIFHYTSLTCIHFPKISLSTNFHCLFAKVFLNPLIIFENQTKFIIDSTSGTTITNPCPNVCICSTCFE